MNELHINLQPLDNQPSQQSSTEVTYGNQQEEEVSYYNATR